MRSTIGPLHLVVLGLTAASRTRTVGRSPQRRSTLETPPEAAPRPPTRTPEPADAETARRTDSQLRVTPSRDRESAGPSEPSETREGAGAEESERHDPGSRGGPRDGREVGTQAHEARGDRRARAEDPQGARRRLRGQLYRRGDPRPDVRATLDAAGRAPVRRDHLGIPHRRHQQRDRQERVRDFLQPLPVGGTSAPECRRPRSSPPTKSATTRPGFRQPHPAPRWPTGPIAASAPTRSQRLPVRTRAPSQHTAPRPSAPNPNPLLRAPPLYTALPHLICTRR